MLFKRTFNPAKEPEPIQFRGFQCYGDGLTCHGYYRADLAMLSQALQSNETPTNPPPRVAKQAHNPLWPKRWWVAQAKLYGLKVTRKWKSPDCKQALTAALATGTLDVPDDLKEVEERLNSEYAQKKKDFEVHINEKYNSASTDEDKARINHTRFLTELNGNVAVLRGFSNGDRSGITKAASNLGLKVRSVYDDVNGNWIIVVGEDKAKLLAATAGVQDEIDAEKANIREERRQNAIACHQELIRTANSDDISGHWLFHMPKYDKARETWGIEEDDSMGENTMDIAPHHRGDLVVWASLNFPDPGQRGWLKIFLLNSETERIPMNTEMKLGWQFEYFFEDDERHVEHEIPNSGVVTFTSAHECFGSLTGWIGGPYKFHAIKFGLQSTADVAECKEQFNRLQEIEDDWRSYYIRVKDDIEEDD